MVLSCSKENRWDAFKGTGKRITETRAIASFTSIYVEDKIDLVLTQGPAQELSVEAGEKLVPLIETEVDEKGELRISNHNRCDWARSYKKGNITVHITSPDFRLIRHWGSGIIRSNDTIHADTLEIVTHESGDVNLTVNTHITYIINTGSADVTLRGFTSLLGVYHNGEGYNYCEGLDAEIIWTTSEASGNEYYHPTKELYATLSWDGDIYYKGTPSVQSSIKGSGKLISIN